MINYNHIKVLSNLKKLWPKNSDNHQFAEDLEALLEEGKGQEELLENEFFKATIDSLRSEMTARLTKIVASDPELRASVNLLRRFMTKEDTERLVRKTLEEYLGESELLELST